MGAKHQGRHPHSGLKVRIACGSPSATSSESHPKGALEVATRRGQPTIHERRGTNLCGFVVQKAFELAGTDGVLQLANGFGFDLPNALTSNFEERREC